MANSSVKSGDGKAKLARPKKPFPKFPLYAHANGKWAKKINGHFEYFGRWGKIEGGVMVRLPGDGWKEALDLYNAQAEDLHAGRKPRAVKPGAATIGDLRDSFLTAKTNALEAGKIQRRTYFEYKATMLMMIEQFGEKRLLDDIRVVDFAGLLKVIDDRWGIVRRGNEVQKVRTIFKYAFDAELVDKPTRFGPDFKKPNAKEYRANRNAKAQKMLEPAEVRQLIEAAPVPLKAMILLGLNCGFGNHDCATLPLSALDLEKGFVNYPRPKTAIARRCPLWPETVAALKDALAVRPEPKTPEGANLVFLTAQRRPWLSGGIANPVSCATRDVMKAVGIHKPGLGHYTLRHVFRTVADGARDQVSANYIMGHADSSMAATYRERIDDSRLIAVSNFVRAWVLGEDSPATE